MIEWCEGLVAQAADYGLISGCVQQALRFAAVASRMHDLFCDRS